MHLENWKCDKKDGYIRCNKSIFKTCNLTLILSLSTQIPINFQQSLHSDFNHSHLYHQSTTLYSLGKIIAGIVFVTLK